MTVVELSRRVWRGARRSWRVLRWAGLTIGGFLGTGGEARRRLLVVYDFATQPLSVGDILIFQVASLVLRDQYGLGKVDFALAFDPQRPVVNDPAFSHVDSSSFLYHLAAFLPAAQVNPHLGSVMLFDSHRALERFVADNEDAYHVWPSFGQYASREYLFYDCFNRLFFDHFQRTGSLPALGCRPAAAAWAKAFIARHAGQRAAVTVQLRHNPSNPARDSDYPSWLAFFESARDRYPVVFIVICAPGEIDPRLRGRDNVILAKDHATTVEQDLALIEAACIHLGAASGPGTLAQFSNKPYCMFNMVMDTTSVRGFEREAHRHSFFFSTPLQCWIEGRESADVIAIEFDRLWIAVRAQHAAPQYA